MQIKSINTEAVHAIVEEDIFNGAQDTYRFSTLLCACGNIILLSLIPASWNVYYKT